MTELEAIEKELAELDKILAPQREEREKELWKGRGSALAQAVTLGGADELYGVARALMDDGGTFKERYQQHQQGADRYYKDYARENPGEALAIDLVGGMLIPGGIVTKGLGKAAKGARSLGRARKLANPKLTDKILNPNIARSMLRRRAADSAAEGAIAGALSADSSEDGGRLMGALTGGALGGAVGTGVGAVQRGAASTMGRRILPDLDTVDAAGNAQFTPVWMQADHIDSPTAARAARWGVRSPEAMTHAAQMERPLLRSTEAKVNAADAVKDAVKKAGVERLENTRVANREALNQQATQMRKQRLRARQANKADKAQKIEALDEASFVDEILRRDGNFQNNAVRHSLPENTPPNTAAKILANPDTGTQIAALRGAIQKHGFADVKGKDFDITPSITRLPTGDVGIQGHLDAVDPLYQNALRQYVPAAMARFDDGASRVNVSGEHLLEASNKMASEANTLSKMQNFDTRQVAALREGAQHIRNTIRAGLSKDAQKRFDKDLTRHGSTAALEAAATRARVKESNPTLSPQQYIDELMRNNTFMKGGAIYQNVAEEARDKSAEAVEAFDTAISSQKKAVRKQFNKVKDELAEQEIDNDAALKAARADARANEKTVKKKAAKQLKKAKKKLEEAQEKHQKLSARRHAQVTSREDSYANIGRGISGALGSASTTAHGAVQAGRQARPWFAETRIKPEMQRLYAGQTGPQKAAQALYGNLTRPLIGGVGLDDITDRVYYALLRAAARDED